MPMLEKLADAVFIVGFLIAFVAGFIVSNRRGKQYRPPTGNPPLDPEVPKQKNPAV